MLAVPRVSAQQNTRVDLALGLEGNINTLTGASGAASFSAALGLSRVFSTGLKTGYSRDFSGINTLEMAALVRGYFLSSEKSQVFAQLELGADLIFYEGETVPAPLWGLALGWRIPLGSWYLEPALRGGYPYLWGLGLGFGRRI